MTTLFRKIQKADYYIPRWFKKDLIHILSKILVPNPLRRFTITDLLTHKWWLKGGPYQNINETEGGFQGNVSKEEIIEETNMEGGSQFKEIEIENSKKYLFASTLNKEEALKVLNSNLESMAECVYVTLQEEKLRGEFNYGKVPLKVKAFIKEVNKRPILNMVVMKKVGGNDKDFKKLAKSIETFMDS